MGTSLFIAKILGLYYLVMGVGFLFNRRVFQQVMEDFCKNAAVVLYGGLLALAIGIAIILKHNIWVANWTVIITIIGWLAFVKGVWLIIFPSTVFKFMQVYQKSKNLMLIQALIALILGAILTFFGFFAG